MADDERWEPIEENGEREVVEKRQPGDTFTEKKISVTPDYGSSKDRAGVKDTVEVVESEKRFIKRKVRGSKFAEDVQVFSRAVSSFKSVVGDFSKTVKFFCQTSVTPRLAQPKETLQLTELKREVNSLVSNLLGNFSVQLREFMRDVVPVQQIHTALVNEIRASYETVSSHIFSLAKSLSTHFDYIRSFLGTIYRHLLKDLTEPLEYEDAMRTNERPSTRRVRTTRYTHRPTRSDFTLRPISFRGFFGQLSMSFGRNIFRMFSPKLFLRDLVFDLFDLLGQGLLGPLYNFVESFVYSKLSRLFYRPFVHERHVLRPVKRVPRSTKHEPQLERREEKPPAHKKVTASLDFLLRERDVDHFISAPLTAKLLDIKADEVRFLSPVTLLQERQAPFVAKKLSLKVERQADVQGLDGRGGFFGLPFGRLLTVLRSRLPLFGRIGATALLTGLLFTDIFTAKEITDAKYRKERIAGLVSRTAFSAGAGFVLGGPKGALLGALVGGLLYLRPWERFIEQQERERQFFVKSYRVLVRETADFCNLLKRGFLQVRFFVVELSVLKNLFESFFRRFYKRLDNLSESLQSFGDELMEVIRFLKGVVVNIATALHQTIQKAGSSVKVATQRVAAPFKEVGQTVTEIIHKNIGDISALFESGKRLWDNFERSLSLFTVGMKRYLGPWQMTRETFEKFAIEYGYWPRLRQEPWLSKSFLDKWKKVVEEVGEEVVLQQQREFLTKTHYHPLLRKLGERGEILVGKGKALQEQLFTISVQYGPTLGSRLVERALQKYTTEQLRQLDPLTLLKEIQQYRKTTLETYFPRFSADVKKAISRRLDKELQYYRSVVELEQTQFRQKPHKVAPDIEMLVGTDVKPVTPVTLLREELRARTREVSFESLKKDLQKSLIEIPRYEVDYHSMIHFPELPIQHEQKPEQTGKLVLPTHYMFDIEQIPNYIDDIATVLVQLGLI